MSEPTAYDRVPYDSFPFAQTHPSHLCALARLHGVPAPDPRNARVLEIGCASGGNLIPMAEQLPFGSFIGLDLSARQIAMAKSTAADANLNNVTFTHADIATFDGGGQQYDYIIAHGVYSWMPEIARDALMRFCANSLSETGIAYVSYNTYPGWHLRGAIRDMMMYHARTFESDAQQIQQARSLLRFLQENAATGADAYSLLLKREADVLAKSSDAYIRHEHLSGDNVPMYFHQFARKAADFSLKFLAEAELASHSTANLTDEARDAIESLSQDVVRREQYLDFLRNRTFRQSLLVKDGVATLPTAQASLLDSLALSAELTCSPPGNETDDYTFTAKNGTSLSTSDAALVAVLTELMNRRPDRLSAAALIASGRQESDRERLRHNLTHCVQAGLIAIHAIDAPCAVTLDARPVGSRVARAQAARGEQVATLNHQILSLEPLTRHVLSRLDGSLTQPELLDELIDAVVHGEIRMAQEGRPIVEPGEIRERLVAQVEAALEFLLRNALLTNRTHVVEGRLAPRL